MRVVMMTPCLARGDAVTHDALGMAETLQAHGHEVLLTSRFNDGRHPAIPLDEALRFVRRPDCALIYHHSIGNEEVLRIFQQARGPRIVKYHNITPPEFFKHYDPFAAKSCIQGREQIARLTLPNVELWTDSDFNGRDWQIHSGRPMRYNVLPPFHQVDRLCRTAVDASTRTLIDDWRTTILLVGRIAPNKNQALAIEAFSLYLQKYDPQARLVLVGSRVVGTYCDQFMDRVRELGLGEQIIITGKISTSELKTFYLGCSMLLTTSLHEGFCVPLLEAMALKVPSVAVRKTAIPETGGDAVWYSEASSEALAATMHRVQTETETVEEKLIVGWQRYRDQFKNYTISQRFIALFDESVSRFHSREVALDEPAMA